MAPVVFSMADTAAWPPAVREFWDSGEAERFSLAGDGGDRIEYLVRGPDRVEIFSRPLGHVRMNDLTAQIRETRTLVGQANERDLQRGITTVLLILIAALWIVSFIALIYLASRMSRPIQQLTAGLGALAAGNLDTRIETTRTDEIGTAIHAFNRTAQELRQGREKLVYLTQVASWQLLARKMAHELKNSLTPIRLTVEEIRARQAGLGDDFLNRAVQIVTSEVESLERRIRAFSEFSSEPEVRLMPLDLNGLIEERITLLKPGYPEVAFEAERATGLPLALADADRVRGVLTNLLANAAQAAPQGRILVRTFAADRAVHIEVHDSGPGLSKEAQRTLFEPTITFKDGGMGLGLSIARKNALVCAGDLVLIESRLGGAGFRVTLPRHDAGKI
jgi:nitrogen fixation/metabolism regulation signal transduction histidine kinase